MKKKVLLIGVFAACLCLVFAGCAQAQTGEQNSSVSSDGDPSTDNTSSEESPIGGLENGADDETDSTDSNGVDGISTEERDAAMNAAEAYFTSMEVEIDSMEVQEQSGLYDEYLDSSGAGNVLVLRAYATGNANPRYVVLTRADSTSEWEVASEIE